MFHTFEGFGNPDTPTPSRGRNERQQSVSRRVTTLRACTSCRQRKIKCDGDKPCEACRWYKKADLCQYSDPRPSRRHVEKLSNSLDEYRSVLERLFPDMPPESLVHLPRENLLELIGRNIPHQHSLTHHTSSPSTSTSVDIHISPSLNEDGNLESLQTMPEEFIDDQRPSNGNIANGVSDDVNALSLSTRQPSSYLGVSSVHAVLKVIAWVDPNSLYFFSRIPAVAGQQNHIMDFSFSANTTWQTQDYEEEQGSPQVHRKITDMQLIDAYFTHIQPFVPMLDEQSFRQSYVSKSRKDSGWLALLNTVLALGSIVAGTSDDTSHRTYFQRAKSYLGLDSLGCSDLETVQTLGLIGGYYLHYTSQPNLAYSLMGAALRMAAALGLHKEFSNNREVPSKQKIASMDLKRRVWWSLFCMDTWGSMTLGRPSMGRFGPTITVQLPHYRDAGNILGILPLIENIRFCKIATQIQEVLAVVPLVKHIEIAHFDNQLLEWYDDLPSVLKDHEPCSESILMTRTIMRWRYFNLRMLLYRPTLLNYAMRRVPYIALRAEERMAIERCREIAEVAIQDICATATQSQMSGWNAVWLVFQAVMVPLLGLFLNDDTAADPRATVEGCQAQVDMAMLVLARMQTWSPTAKRTLDAVARIFEASKRGPSMSEETDSTSTGSYTAAHESYFHTITPPVLSSQPDAGRIMIADDGGLSDALVSQFVDNSISQDLWDYLSWSDSSIWPALSDSENTNDSVFLGHGDKDKSGSNNASFLNSIADTAYLVNMSTSY